MTLTLVFMSVALALNKERRLKIIKEMLMRRIYGRKREEETGGWGNLTVRISQQVLL
jgi:hypothetical protein